VALPKKSAESIYSRRFMPAPRGFWLRDLEARNREIPDGGRALKPANWNQL